MKRELENASKNIDEINKEGNELKRTIEDKQSELNFKDEEILSMEHDLGKKNREINQIQKELDSKLDEIEKQKNSIDFINKELSAREKDFRRGRGVRWNISLEIFWHVRLLLRVARYALHVAGVSTHCSKPVIPFGFCQVMHSVAIDCR